MLCTLIIPEGSGIDRIDEPVSFGLPFPCGVLSEPSRLSLIDQRSQQPLPLQVEALDHWADGSVRWALLDFQATVAARETAEYHLGFAHATPSIQALHVSLIQSQDIWTVDTSVARFALNTRTLKLFDEVISEGVAIGEAAGSQIVLTDAGGQAYEPRIDHIEVEAPGPVRLSLDMRGKLIAPGREPLANFMARMSFYAGSGVVEVKLTVHNPRAAKHLGGLWDLGDPGSISL